VILDITWFSKYHAVIDCQDKKVTFRISHQSTRNVSPLDGRTKEIVSPQKPKRKENQSRMNF